jgi:heat shock protein HslJ
VSGDGLRFLDKEKRPIATFLRFDPIGLEVRAWQIVEYSDGKKLIPFERDAWVRFIHGHVNGTPGCSRGFVGSYELSENRLMIPSLSYLATGFCRPGYETQNALVVAALEGELTVILSERDAILRDANGTDRIRLKAYDD